MRNSREQQNTAERREESEKSASEKQKEKRAGAKQVIFRRWKREFGGKRRELRIWRKQEVGEKDGVPDQIGNKTRTVGDEQVTRGGSE